MTEIRCCEPTEIGARIRATCCQNGRDRCIETVAAGRLQRLRGDLVHAEAVAARLVEVICEMQGELDNYDGAPAWYAR